MFSDSLRSQDCLSVRPTESNSYSHSHSPRVYLTPTLQVISINMFKMQNCSNIHVDCQTNKQIRRICWSLGVTTAKSVVANSSSSTSTDALDKYTFQDAKNICYFAFCYEQPSHHDDRPQWFRLFLAKATKLRRHHLPTCVGWPWKLW